MKKSIDDSMLKDRSLFQKLKLMVQFSPAFLTSFVFKVGSFSIIFSLLGLSFFSIYVLIGSVVTSIVAFYSSSKTFKEVRFCHAITYTNAPILGKDLHGNRKENYPKMMTASIICLILHTLTLTMLMIWVGAMDPSDPPSPLV